VSVMVCLQNPTLKDQTDIAIEDIRIRCNCVKHWVLSIRNLMNLLLIHLEKVSPVADLKKSFCLCSVL
jgi:hypothetical protein